jgi:hypothetical protein
MASFSSLRDEGRYNGSRSRGFQSVAQRRFTVGEYHHRMAETGILGPDERVELVRGFIYVRIAVAVPVAGLEEVRHEVARPQKVDPVRSYPGRSSS